MLGSQLLQQQGEPGIKTEDLLDPGTAEDGHLPDRFQVRTFLNTEFAGLAAKVLQVGRRVKELGEKEGGQVFAGDDNGESDVDQSVTAVGFEVLARRGRAPIVGESGEIGVALDAALTGRGKRRWK